MEKDNEVVVLDDEVLVEEEEEDVVEEEEDTSTEPTVKQKKRAKSGSAAYNSKFNSAWTKEWPFIKQGTTEFHFWCEVCRCKYHIGSASRSARGPSSADYVTQYHWLYA